MVDWWKTLFRDVRDYRSSESRNRRTSKVQKASEVSKNRQNSRQRIPLIDPPLPGQQLASMEEIQTILNESYAKFINAGQRITVAKKALVSWNCTFCSDCTKNITLSNEMDTFLHIVKVNHQKKMNGQATRSDLLYWKEWVDRWDAETTVTAQCLIEPTEVPQNVHEANGYIRSVNYLSTVRTDHPEPETPQRIDSEKSKQSEQSESLKDTDVQKSADSEINPDEIFQKFTEYEKELIKNVDPIKLCYLEIEKLFGNMCSQCDEMMLNSMAILNHFTSDKHFQNVRKTRPVKKSEIEGIMEIVRRNQKDKS